MKIDELPRDPDTVFMASAMTWLRSILTPPYPLPAPQPTPAEEDVKPLPWWKRGWWWFFGRRGGPSLIFPASLTPAEQEPGARRARRELERAMAANPAPRFTRLCDAFGLFPFERDVALICLGHAVSTEVPGLCAAVPGSVNGLPTYALALGLAADPEWESTSPDDRSEMIRLAAVPEWDALSPVRPLRHWRILEITQPGGQALITSPLRMDERIVNHLMGLDYLDDRLMSLLEPCLTNGDDSETSGTQQAQVDFAVGHLKRRQRQSRRRLVQMPGGDSVTKRMFAQRIAGTFDADLYRLPLDQVPRDGDLDTFLRLWNRETRLQDVALLIDAIDATGEAAPVLSRLLDGVEGLVLLDILEPLANQDTVLMVDVARPDPAEQRAAWQSLLGIENAWPERLAGQFNLNLGEVTQAAVTAEDETDVGKDGGEAVWEVCRTSARPRLEGLAQRITSSTRLTDVQLASNEKRLLEQVRDQARHRLRVYDDFGFRSRLSRGLGITALLAGESGTGKTMASEALANELSLDLYRIDLSSVVSKYIGETEKNIRRVFDAAEQSGAVLLFDEADAIFGKRSEVHDSHDRYANIEVSYLLQRMEAYAGLAILTTNMKNALDPAFLRRLRFIITFPYPGAAERERIWRDIFPKATGADVAEPESRVPGVDRLDFGSLAQVSLTGGQIRNIAVNAAFLAAAVDGAVTMEILKGAAIDELRKSGKPIAAADFAGWRTTAEMSGLDPNSRAEFVSAEAGDKP